jgi:hypothetical protein
MARVLDEARELIEAGGEERAPIRMHMHRAREAIAGKTRAAAVAN